MASTMRVDALSFAKVEIFVVRICFQGSLRQTTDSAMQQTGTRGFKPGEDFRKLTVIPTSLLAICVESIKHLQPYRI